MKNDMNQTLSNNELENRITEYQARIMTALAPYQAESAVCHWLDTLRGIEELINLVTIDWNDDTFKHQLHSLPVFQLMQKQAMPQLQFIRRRLAERFTENFVNRFSNLLMQSSAIAIAFATHGLIALANEFQTLGSTIGYFQSRRRHFVGMLHLLPTACKGHLVVNQLDTLNIFLPVVEGNATPMMGAQYRLMVKLAQERLEISLDSSTELAMLDGLFLEPERVSIIEMPRSEKSSQILKEREPLLTDRLFSAAELRNDILLIEAAYAEFDLRDTDFSIAASLVRRLSREYIDRDYWIQISPLALTTLMNEEKASPMLVQAFTCHESKYMTCLSSYAPLVLLDNRYLSTVSLLGRFMYFWRARILGRKKRFQIRAGFIFEDQVKLALERQGFIVQDIARINRQEFDVVTVREGIIWNVQCKNNFVDLESVDSDAAAFARYNCSLVRSYERALKKEYNREHLLSKKLSLENVQHMIVSRFPVVTDNLRIVVFSRIASFTQRADAILVESANKSPNFYG